MLVDEYLRDGVVGPIDVLTVEEATQMKDEFLLDVNNVWNSAQATNKNSQDQEPQQGPQIYHQNNNFWFKAHLFVPFVNHIVRHPKLVKAVQTVLQSNDIRCWSCDFNVRYRNANTIIAPHQDATYAGLYPAQHVVTAWIALSDPVTVYNGGLLFFKSSHLMGQLPHICDGDGSSMDTNYENINQEKNLRNILSRSQRCAIPNLSPETDDSSTSATSIPLRAGQATLHHFYTVHSSGQNLSSDEPRIGLAVRYMTAAVRRRHCHVKEMITWISGCTDIVHDDCFDWEPILPEFPTSDDIERGKLAHAVAMEREMANYFSPGQVPEK
jgi:ectoine hydroxylase-related dioxygenase (phytanoyl-CoA dioxygenase family)